MTLSAHPLKEKYARSHIKRTTTCPGCGIGTVSQAILRAIDELELNMDDFVFVSGIGCSAWIPSPFYNADTLHTTHGRPIAFATGVKLGLPDKHVMVVSGDGDLTAIGGKRTNGFLRKCSTFDLNIDLAAIPLQLLDLRLLLDLKTLKYERGLEPRTIEHADKHADT